MRAAAAHCLAVLVLGGCDAPPDEPATARGPIIVATTPVDGATHVGRRPEIRLELDRIPAPASVNRGTIQLVSGDQTALLSLRVDPIDQAILARLFDPAATLEPEVDYR